MKFCVSLVLILFSFVSLFAFIESVAPRPGSHTQLDDNCLYHLLIMFILFLFGDVAFFECYLPLPFPFYMESMLYVFLQGGVFLPCDHGLGFLHQLI